MRFRCSHFSIGLVLLALFSTSACASRATPKLEIDKPVWALGEDIFFFAGLTKDGPLVDGDYHRCRVEITTPGSSVRRFPIRPGVDGSPQAHEHTTSFGLPTEETEEGEYLVTVACGDEGAEVASGSSFEVRRMEVLDEIDFRLEFEPSCDGDPRDETVAWVVENRSSFPVLAAPPGTVMMNSIAFRLKKPGLGFSCKAFVPEKLIGPVGSALFDRLNWDNVVPLGAIAVPAGETYHLDVCLSVLRDVDCAAGWPPKYVRATASTQILVGPRDGPWADAGPFRLSASEERVLPDEPDLGEPDP